MSAQVASQDRTSQAYFTVHHKIVRVAQSFDNDALVSFSRTNIPHQPVRGLDRTSGVSVKLGLALDNEGHLRAHAEGQTPLDSKARRT